MRWIVPTLIAILVAAGFSSSSQELGGDETADPIDVGQIEEVEVRLVLLDVLVLDRRDRTVPGLTVEQFRLQVDSKDVEIASLDVNCPLGIAKDPRARQSVAVPDPAPGAAPMRIVHAFDYYHMSDFIPRTIESAKEAIDRLSTGNEEHMIVTIGTGLRIQTPFTSDLERIGATLERMYEDPTLYAGFYGRLTERPFYRRMVSLIDFLELVDGAKIVVLYSGPFRPDGFFHDPEFKKISAMAAKARVALYPVDSGGMRTPRGFRYGDLGGPKELARLAVETGGRVTFHTNDLGLALARAQRDHGCRYTLGFYDRAPKLDEVRRVSIMVEEGGVRAVYPVHYVLRSETSQLESQARTAAMVPEMYEDGGMAAIALALKPRSPSRWEVLIAVDLPEPTLMPEETSSWNVVGRVMTPSGAFVRSFQHELSSPDWPRSIVERVTLKPGSYRTSVVLSRDGTSMPWATHADIELTDVPAGEPFLVGPHLGIYVPYLPGDLDETDTTAGPVWRFEPLIEGRASRDASVDALTWVCRVGDEDPATQATVRRELSRTAGETVGTFDPVRVELDDGQKLSCRALVDSIDTAALESGSYEMRAYLGGDERSFRTVLVVTD